MLRHLCPQVTPSWYAFGNAVGMNEEQLKDLFNYDSGERLQKTVEYWLRKSERNPTWKDLATILRKIQFHTLAENLMKEYANGE